MSPSVSDHESTLMLLSRGQDRRKPRNAEGRGDVEDLPQVLGYFPDSAANRVFVPGFGAQNSRFGTNKFPVCQAREFGRKPLIRLQADSAARGSAAASSEFPV